MTKQQLKELSYPLIVDSAAGAIVWEGNHTHENERDKELIKNFVMEQMEGIVEKWVLYYLDEELLVRDRGADLCVYRNEDDLADDYDLERLEC